MGIKRIKILLLWCIEPMKEKLLCRKYCLNFSGKTNAFQSTCVGRQASAAGPKSVGSTRFLPYHRRYLGATGSGAVISH